VNKPSLVIKFASILLSFINKNLLTHLLLEKKIAHTETENNRKIMHEEASTQTTDPFSKALNKTFLLFGNVKQEEYDSSSKQVKIIGFSVFNISCFP
jgi:hypothetical protein